MHGAPNCQIVRSFDALVDGAIGGHFLQVAPVLRGETVYLGRVPAAALASGAGSEALTIVDIADPGFAAQHWRGAVCVGDQILRCETAGLYATHLLPAITTAADADGVTLSLPFLASMWDPYDVALFGATVRLVHG